MQLSDFLKNKGKKKGETLSQRERHPRLLLGLLVLYPPHKETREVKEKEAPLLPKPADRLQGEAQLSESFAPSMEAHSGSVSSSLLGALLVQSPVLCPPQIAFFYLNKKSKVHFC